MSSAPQTPSELFQEDVDQSSPDNALDSAFEGDLATRTLSLAECIHIALARNPQTAVSWQTAHAAAADVGHAKGEYLPAIGFNSRATRSDPAELENEPQSAGAGAMGGTNDPGPQNRYEATFGLRYLLFDGGGRKARLEGADADLLAANFRHNAVL